MAFMASVLNVMIASPSDVTQERLAIRDVIAEWNTIHARDRKTVLMSVGWETHSVPDMGDRPQAIINKQLSKDADLLIAVFWARIGSPTGVSQSGTIEEIEEHLKAGKPAMIYFSSVPVNPDRIDEDQYKALRKFKQSIKDRGLFEEYDSPAEFRAKFSRQLAQKIITSFPTRDSVMGAGDARKAEVDVNARADMRGTIWFTLLQYNPLQDQNKDGSGLRFRCQCANHGVKSCEISRVVLVLSGKDFKDGYRLEKSLPLPSVRTVNPGEQFTCSDAVTMRGVKLSQVDRSEVTIHLMDSLGTEYPGTVVKKVWGPEFDLL
jgi:hypothetical protein